MCCFVSFVFLVSFLLGLRRLRGWRYTLMVAVSLLLRLHVMSIMGNSWCFVLELEVPALHFLILSLHSCSWYAPAPDISFA